MTGRQAGRNYPVCASQIPKRLPWKWLSWYLGFTVLKENLVESCGQRKRRRGHRGERRASPGGGSGVTQCLLMEQMAADRENMTEMQEIGAVIPKDSFPSIEMSTNLTRDTTSSLLIN